MQASGFSAASQNKNGIAMRHLIGGYKPRTHASKQRVFQKKDSTYQNQENGYCPKALAPESQHLIIGNFLYSASSA
jgi:hypothetical protein